MLDKILTQAQSPVARMRLLSGGIQPNNRLEKGEAPSVVPSLQLASILCWHHLVIY